MNYYKTLVLTVCLLIISTSVHAYIDPVTGSLIIQGLIAAVVGALAMIKFQYARVKSFFRKVIGKTDEVEGADSCNTDSCDEEQNLKQEKQKS